jgi:hypothetical protein
MQRRLAFGLAVLLPMLALPLPAAAQTKAGWQPAAGEWRLDLEYQRYDVMKNVVQRPNDAEGTRFSVTDYAGSQGNNARITAWTTVNWFKPGDGLRFVIAPYRQSGTGTPSEPILYDGGLFKAGVPLDVVYKFNTYRITYDAPIFESTHADGWELRIGGTLAVRDAQVKLSQPGIERDFTNWGPVPLLYFSATRDLGSGWRLLGEFDAFPAPGGGGLFDGSLKLAYDVARDTALTIGYRYEFGGASGADFYNFLRVGAVVAGVNVRF